MYVCPLRVYNWFTHSLRTFLACAAHDAIAMELEIEVEDLEDRRQRQNKSRCMEDG